MRIDHVMYLYEGPVTETLRSLLPEEFTGMFVVGKETHGIRDLNSHFVLTAQNLVSQGYEAGSKYPWYSANPNLNWFERIWDFVFRVKREPYLRGWIIFRRMNWEEMSRYERDSYIGVCPDLEEKIKIRDELEALEDLANNV